jgi:hypothetical protein
LMLPARTCGKEMAGASLVILMCPATKSCIDGAERR